ncbi:uncharacterized protein LOC131622118 [Vicia villosa]|uniref:uncharacterized protein LOC131622118 n=1 Tax=Vicia villosa TaxID=3911 RepID=UPI00273B0DD3|nr:uncharacterized protein LOC131622118 [Vicia villosa]
MARILWIFSDPWIAISNFKSKVISKILAERLASIMPLLISQEQRGFIYGRQILYCIELAYEGINLLDTKVWCGNLALKVDIRKAFDTHNWDFLFKVLQQFGFNDQFCSWIRSILHSVFLCININGALHGFFACSRGVRQGDLLPPLLFCLAEEVISMRILQLVLDRKLNLISDPKNIMVPSHILYVGDVLIFCKGTFQISKISPTPSKSMLQFQGSMSIVESHIFLMEQCLFPDSVFLLLSGFNIGFNPFTYLGV